MDGKRATGLFSGLASALRTWLRRRQERAELSEMNYCDLKDLGFAVSVVTQAKYRDGDPFGSSCDVRRVIARDCTDPVQVSR